MLRKHFCLLGTACLLATLPVVGVAVAQQRDSAKQDPARQSDQNDQLRPDQQLPDDTPQPGQRANDRRRAFDRDADRTPAGKRSTIVASGDSQDALLEMLTAKLMLANHTEIQLAQIATQQAKQQEVKQFAEMLVREHQQLNQQLESIVPHVAAKIKTKLQSEPAFNTTAGSQDRDSDRIQRGFRGTEDRRDSPKDRNDQDQNDQQRGDVDRDDDQQLDRRDRGAQAQEARRRLLGRGDEGRQTEELGDYTAEFQETAMAIACSAASHHLQLSKQMLQRYQGQDFDMAFLGQQLAAHTWLLAELKAIEPHAPSQLQSVVKVAQAKTEQHLNTAQQLSQKFEDDRRTDGDNDAQPRRTEKRGDFDRLDRTERQGDTDDR